MATHLISPTFLAGALAERLAGEVLAPDIPVRDRPRVWNGMIDKRPAGDRALRRRRRRRHRCPLRRRARACRSPSAAAATTSRAPPSSTTAS
jgi:hypothetical protein